MLQLVFSTLFSMLILIKVAFSEGNITNSTIDYTSHVPIVELPSTEKASFELYNGNFQHKLSDYSYVLVLFFKKTSDENFKKLDEEYEKAAVAVRSIDFHHLSVALAKVDCGHEEALCKEQKELGSEFPNMILYNRGLFKTFYDGPLEHDHIQNFVYTYIVHNHMAKFHEEF